MDLLERVKRKLKVSWPDDDTDIELADMIEDTKVDLNQLLGAEIDYSAPGPARDLFLNYCLYKHNGCGDEFKNVYLADIITYQNQLLVERKMQDANGEEEGA